MKHSIGLERLKKSFIKQKNQNKNRNRNNYPHQKNNNIQMPQVPQRQLKKVKKRNQSYKTVNISSESQYSYSSFNGSHNAQFKNNIQRKDNLVNSDERNSKSFEDLGNAEVLKRLESELKIVVKENSLSEKQRLVRQKTIDRLKLILKEVSPRLEIYGSFMTGLSLPTSDIDITVFTYKLSNENKSKSKIREDEQRAITSVVNKLHRLSLIKYGTLQIIRTCRVPLIKFTDKESNIPIDITFNQENGVECTLLISPILKENSLLRDLVVIIKSLLRQYSLNDASLGGLSSFVIFHLVLIYTRIFDVSYKIETSHKLSLLFIGFLKFISIEFDYDNYSLISKMAQPNCQTPISKNIGIKLNEADLLSQNNKLSSSYLLNKGFIQSKGIIFPSTFEDRLSIQSILDSSIDIGVTGREYPEVKRLFSACLHQLKMNARSLLQEEHNHQQTLLRKIITVEGNSINQPPNEMNE